MTAKERLEQEYASLAGSVGFDIDSIDRSRVESIVNDIDRVAVLTKSAYHLRQHSYGAYLCSPSLPLRPAMLIPFRK